MGSRLTLVVGMIVIASVMIVGSDHVCVLRSEWTGEVPESGTKEKKHERFDKHGPARREDDSPDKVATARCRARPHYSSETIQTASAESSPSVDDRVCAGWLWQDDVGVPVATACRSGAVLGAVK